MRTSDTDKEHQKREKQDRLSKALRDNLFRRKQQMRNRKQAAAQSIDQSTVSSDDAASSVNTVAPEER